MDTLLRATSFSRRLHFLVALLAEHRLRVVGVVATAVAMSLADALIPFFTKFQVDLLQEQQTLLPFLSSLSPVHAFLALLVLPALIELIRLAAFERLDQRIRTSMDTELQIRTEKLVWEKLVTLDAGFFSNRRNQPILQTVLDAASITGRFARLVLGSLGRLTSIIAITPLLGTISPFLLLVVLAASGMQAAIATVSRRWELLWDALISREHDNVWKVRSPLHYQFLQLKTAGAVEEFLDRYHTAVRRRQAVELRRTLSRQGLHIYEWISRNGLTIVSNFIVGLQVLHGDVSIGTFTIVVSYTVQLNRIFQEMIESVREWQEIDLQFDRLQFFASMTPRTRTVPHPHRSFEPPYTVQMQDVSFSYPDFHQEERAYLDLILRKTQGFLCKFSSYWYQRELEEWKKITESPLPSRDVLRGIDLSLRQGEVLALLGRNGAGKTTLTRLMMHHYEPTKGNISLCGKVLPTYDIRAIARQFSVIEQQPFIIERFTVRENILLGIDVPPTEKELWDVLDRLDVRGAVESLPKGMDTVIGEEATLSGGELQLLAVARVFLQRRPFVIFDEGMNQLDVEHEARIVSLLRELSTQSAVLFITHRVTTARKADRIAILDEGNIVEEGHHQELLARKGLYAHFWSLQVVE